MTGSKTDESLRRAISLNVLATNIDHVEEVDRIYDVARSLDRKARVGVRLGLVSTSQLGLDVESGEAFDVCRKLLSLSDYLELTCVHFNVVSNAKTPAAHETSALRALEFVARLKSELGVVPVVVCCTASAIHANPEVSGGCSMNRIRPA